MARKKSKTDPAADDAGEKDGGGSKLLPVGVLSLAIVAAGYFIGGRGSAAPAAADPAAAEAAAAAEAEPAEPEIAEIVDLDAINVNLTDNHYLRVAISLGIAHEEEEGGGGGGGHGAAVEEVAFPTAPAADLVLTTFAERSMAELSEADGRAAARDELEHHLKEYYGEEVLVTVFFTEFVMQ